MYAHVCNSKFGNSWEPQKNYEMQSARDYSETKTEKENFSRFSFSY